jgi:putative Holliday junction resolvase
VLAIDHGNRRIGLALRPAGVDAIVPLGVLRADSTEEARDRIHKLIDERKVDVVAIGLPVGGDRSQARTVKQFARRLRTGIAGVRWRFVDETLTTHAARQNLKDAGLDRAGRPVDDRAAILILQAFLQDPANA